MFPKNSETPRLRALMDKFDAVNGDPDYFIGLTQDDYALVGQLVVQFGYIDLSLRRLAEAFDNANIIPAWKGKTATLTIADTAKAVQSAEVWKGPHDLIALQAIERHRELRNLIAHCAIKRFPDDDALLFMFKSLRDFKRVFGFDPEPGIAMVAVNDCTEIRNSLKSINHCQKWLASATASLTKQLQPVAA